MPSHVDSSTTAPLSWQADALWQQLEPYLPGLSVEVLARAESTNTVLLERARAGAARADAPITTPGQLEALMQRGLRADPPREADAGGPFGRRHGDTQPCLLVAEHQTLGRGRMGRTWMAAPGASLTFSLALPLAPRHWAGMSLAVGVALADALDAPEPGRAQPRIGLKWPNDLWLWEGPGQGRKLGGVLIETMAVGARRLVVVGVGINITPPPDERADADMSSGFASLREFDRASSAPSVLHMIALPLVRSLLQFEREGFGAFVGAYARRDLLRGQPVQVLSPRGEIVNEGTATSVAANGALCLRDGTGALIEVTSGEVSVRLPTVGRAAPP